LIKEARVGVGFLEDSMLASSGLTRSYSLGVDSIAILLVLLLQYIVELLALRCGFLLLYKERSWPKAFTDSALNHHRLKGVCWRLTAVKRIRPNKLRDLAAAPMRVTLNRHLIAEYKDRYVELA
jgi:hypothetical protein